MTEAEMKDRACPLWTQANGKLTNCMGSQCVYFRKGGYLSNGMSGTWIEHAWCAAYGGVSGSSRLVNGFGDG